MNEEQIRAVKASDVVRTRLPLNAPLTGVVAELKVREGMTVMTGTPMFTIYGLETVWITADVPENLATQLRPGDMVEARTPALPQLVFKGEVSALLPEINQATRTLKARIEIANPRGQLVPGMFATIGFKPSARKGVLTVPVEAVIATGKRSVVMVSLNEGRFTPVDVETGLEANGRIEIRKGLKSGQKVVVSGQFLIDSEASLRGATTRMGEPPAAKGQNATAAQTHRGEGKVESVDNNEVIVSHDPMPTLQWGPMTMVFKPPPGGMPGNVKVGDRVTFEIRQTGNGRYELTRISPAPSTRAPHAHAATAPPASPGRAPRVNPAADHGAPSGEPHHAHH
jgi:Cu(I)/Ag(I) efflux system membrane fusion protein